MTCRENGKVRARPFSGSLPEMSFLRSPKFRSYSQREAGNKHKQQRQDNGPRSDAVNGSLLPGERRHHLHCYDIKEDESDKDGQRTYNKQHAHLSHRKPSEQSGQPTIHVTDHIRLRASRNDIEETGGSNDTRGVLALLTGWPVFSTDQLSVLHHHSDFAAALSSDPLMQHLLHERPIGLKC
jgi:hypothetical protein